MGVFCDMWVICYDGGIEKLLVFECSLLCRMENSVDLLVLFVLIRLVFLLGLSMNEVDLNSGFVLCVRLN